MPYPASHRKEMRKKIVQSARTAREVEARDGSPREASHCTSCGKSSGPPGVGSAHTSSSRKSRVISWMHHGREVCAVSGSLIRESHLYGSVYMESSTASGAVNSHTW